MAVARAHLLQLSLLLFPQVVQIQLLPPSQVELLVVVVVVPRAPHMNRIVLGAFHAIETFAALAALAIVVVATVFAGGLVERRRVGLIVVMVVVVVYVVVVVMVMVMMVVVVFVSFDGRVQVGLVERGGRGR